MTTTKHSDAPVLRIEPELERLLPPLSDAELAGLEADILRRGDRGKNRLRTPESDSKHPD